MAAAGRVAEATLGYICTGAGSREFALCAFGLSMPHSSGPRVQSETVLSVKELALRAALTRLIGVDQNHEKLLAYIMMLRWCIYASGCAELKGLWQDLFNVHHLLGRLQQRQQCIV